jgi:hypothetical protein
VGVTVKKRYILHPDASNEDGASLEVEDLRTDSDGHVGIALYDGATLTVNDDTPTVFLNTADLEGLVEVLQSILEQRGGKEESSA